MRELPTEQQLEEEATLKPRHSRGHWLAGVALVGLAASVLAQEALDRAVLPIPEPKLTVCVELDARRVRPPPRFEIKAPEGAPNVLLVLVDDPGFAGTSRRAA